MVVDINKMLEKIVLLLIIAVLQAVLLHNYTASPVVL